MREAAVRVCLPAPQAREREREARMSAVRLVRWAGRYGASCVQVAESLGVQECTLRAWTHRWRQDRLQSRPLGRPRSSLDRRQRREALDLLNQSKGRVGILSLMTAVTPPAARSALCDLKARWRYAAHRRGGRLCARLVWTRSGAVWALDWTDPPLAVDGVFRKILVVRDLCSGQNLMSLPCQRESGGTAARELSILIARYGAPAVLKMDNGLSLVGTEVGVVLGQNGILALPSPPACPGYNGACEAGIGVLKAYAHHIAAASGRGSKWSCDDLAAARRAVNTRLRENGLSAEDNWVTRRAFGREQRERLWWAYRRQLAKEHVSRGIEPGTQLSRLEQASLDRAAISRALEEEGLVRFRWRWIRPPIRSKKVPRQW
jgi:transposase